MAYGVPYEEVFAEFSDADKAYIKKRAAELREEYLLLEELRKAHDLARVQMAENQQVSRESLLEMEQRADVLLAMLRSHVEAMGGELHLTVTFPNRSPIHLEGFVDLAEADRPEAVVAA